MFAKVFFGIKQLVVMTLCLIDLQPCGFAFLHWSSLACSILDMLLSAIWCVVFAIHVVIPLMKLCLNISLGVQITLIDVYAARFL